MIPFQCPQCGARYASPKKKVGTVITCQRCGTHFPIPSPSSANSDGDAGLSLPPVLAPPARPGTSVLPLPSTAASLQEHYSSSASIWSHPADAQPMRQLPEIAPSCPEIPNHPPEPTEAFSVASSGSFEEGFAGLREAIQIESVQIKAVQISGSSVFSSTPPAVANSFAGPLAGPLDAYENEPASYVVYPRFHFTHVHGLAIALFTAIIVLSIGLAVTLSHPRPHKTKTAEPASAAVEKPSK